MNVSPGSTDVGPIMGVDEVASGDSGGDDAQRALPPIVDTISSSVIPRDNSIPPSLPSTTFKTPNK